MTAGPLRGVVPIPAGAGATGAAPTVAELGDTIIETLFSVGLHLQAVAPATDSMQAEHLRAAVDRLDGLIRVIRDAAFAMSDPSLAPAWANRAAEGGEWGHDCTARLQAPDAT